MTPGPSSFAIWRTRNRYARKAPRVSADARWYAAAGKYMKLPINSPPLQLASFRTSSTEKNCTCPAGFTARGFWVKSCFVQARRLPVTLASIGTSTTTSRDRSRALERSRPGSTTCSRTCDKIARSNVMSQNGLCSKVVADVPASREIRLCETISRSGVEGSHAQ
jgi:hypothetical protein